MQFLNNKNKLYEYMASGAWVLTPNNRLSDELLQQYFKQHDHITVDKPHCMPYSQALEKAYNQLLFKNPEQSHPLLINSSLSHYLWRKILKETPELRFNEGLLKSVIEAWMYCEQWQVSYNHWSFKSTPQTEQFTLWWKQFNAEMYLLKAISEHQLPQYLMQTDTQIFPSTIIWVCFDEFNPQQLDFQKALNGKGIEQYGYDLTNSHPSMPRLFTAPDKKEEYRALIAWLDWRIKAGDERIGVVVPNLQQESKNLKRILAKHFKDFNIYLGKTLGEYHLVAHAMIWLKLGEKLTTHQASLLLQSPYIAFAEEEHLGRANFLQIGSLLQEPLIPMPAFIQQLKPHAPKLATILQSLKPFPSNASIQEWIDGFHDRLEIMGFPGDVALNSETYQCFNRFIAIFDEFRQLNHLNPNLNKQDAMDAISFLVNNTNFQAQGLKSPIQISGLLEASGREFDSLWVMGLTDDCLPQKTQLSPFISPQLQIQLKMPHSTCARQLLFAEQSLERLKQSSMNTVFSFPLLANDNPNLASPLISGYPPFKPLHYTTNPDKTALIAVDEDYQLPLKPGELQSAGTALLANQAKCPFKAFAAHRLYAKPALETTDGLSARERGQIVHQVMENLWKSLHSQEILLKQNSRVLENLVDNAIHKSLDSLKQNRFYSFTEVIEGVEYTRLKALVMSCLAFEKQRPPFEIAALEQSYAIQLGEIHFKVRIDRLDKVGDNKWVIDYKSSLPVVKPWNEERPKEPQLLLYALLDEQINALFFMQLKSQKISFSGISEGDCNIPGVNPIKKEQTWIENINNWKQQLQMLAQEFEQGHCAPMPASLAICQQCDFQKLCRFQKDSSQ